MTDAGLAGTPLPGATAIAANLNPTREFTGIDANVLQPELNNDDNLPSIPKDLHDFIPTQLDARPNTQTGLNRGQLSAIDKIVMLSMIIVGLAVRRCLVRGSTLGAITGE